MRVWAREDCTSGGGIRRRLVVKAQWQPTWQARMTSVVKSSILTTETPSIEPTPLNTKPLNLYTLMNTRYPEP